MLLSDYSLPVNIGNPVEITIGEFAKEVISLVGNPKAGITNVDLPVDDPKQRRPDISLAKSLLDWEPEIDRKEGMKKVYDYFKEVVRI